MNWELLIGPIVGGIIGYITNGIAIKMLFRPLKPIFIGKMKVPFTPGIIPNEKSRIAQSIGRIVGEDLINEEVLTQVLLQDNIYEKIDQKIDATIQKYETDDRSLRAFAEQFVEPEQLQIGSDKMQQQIADKLYTKVIEMNLGQIAMTHLMKAIQEGAHKSLFGAFAFFINDSLIESIALKLEPIINQMVEQEGQLLISQAVEQEGEALWDKPITEIAQKAKQNSTWIKQSLKKAYKHFVITHLPQTLQVIDLSKVVKERIDALDTLALEKILLEIMKKELNAIIGLGALLGAILGCVMSLF